VTGAAELAAALQARVLAARAVNQLAVKAAADQLAAATVDKLMLREHPPGTLTPSMAGQPPAMVTGQLKASVTVTPVTTTGNRAEARVGPTAPYARIQELGGTTSRGTRLPARPYLTPALLEARLKIYAIILERWRTLS
jgi:phage gpG-like protein